MRLIDADALKQIARDHGFDWVDLAGIDAAPTVDPVHAAGGCYCRECKCATYHENFEREPMYECPFSKGAFHDDEDFCSRGEREHD